MKKINLPLTWGYEEFVSEQEQTELKEFALSIRFKTKSNGPGRMFCDKLTDLFDVPDCFFVIRNRIIEIENLKDYVLDPYFGDFLSFNDTDASIHEHKDNNIEGHIHTRYNLLLTVPKNGGNPIYNGNILDIKERMLWRCEAGKYNHASKPVIGNKPRINLSFGFQIKENK